MNEYLLVLEWVENGTLYELMGTCPSEEARDRSVAVIEEIMHDAKFTMVEPETDEVKSEQ